jgi:demethylmenaquinone methyltransferase/2-methoxy-6-polyprenyl-1,4-benzoquinol methylase
MFVDKSPSKVRNMFDKIASSYDLLNQIISFKQDDGLRMKAAQLEATGKVVLDAACGTGEQAIKYSTKNAESVFAVDFSLDMLKVAKKKRAGLRTGSKIHLVCADCRFLPFKSKVIDIVSISFGIRNINDIGSFIKGCNYSLKDDGHLVILEFENTKKSSLFYKLYLNVFIPLIGIVMTRTNSYSYLAKSVSSWLSIDQLTDILKTEGFQVIKSQLESMGTVRLLISRKVAVVPSDEVKCP